MKKTKVATFYGHARVCVCVEIERECFFHPAVRTSFPLFLLPLPFLPANFFLSSLNITSTSHIKDVFFPSSLSLASLTVVVVALSFSLKVWSTRCVILKIATSSPVMYNAKFFYFIFYLSLSLFRFSSWIFISYQYKIFVSLSVSVCVCVFVCIFSVFLYFAVSLMRKIYVFPDANCDFCGST